MTASQVDIKGLAAAIGQPRRQVDVWRHRHILPPEDGKFGGSPWWYRRTINRWVKQSKWARKHGIKVEWE